MEKLVKAIVITLDGEEEIEGRLTTDHAASSYGQPVLIDKDGQIWDEWLVAEVL